MCDAPPPPPPLLHQPLLLREFEPLTSLLGAIPHDAGKKGLFVQNGESLTSIDVSADYVAVGSTAGVLYVYDRQKDSLVHRLQPTVCDT
jgi:hypothetical protein